MKPAAAILFITILACAPSVVAQDFNPTLSARHQKKIESIQNPVSKLNKYKRFYRRDSIRQWRELERYWQTKTDSLSDAIAKKERAFQQKQRELKKDVNNRLYRTVYLPWAIRNANARLKWIERENIRITGPQKTFLYNYLKEHFRDAARDEEKLASVRRMFPEIPLPKRLSGKLDRFSILEPEKYAKLANLPVMEMPSNPYLAKGMAFRTEAGKYLTDVNRYTAYAKDTAAMKEFLKTEGEGRAREYLSENVEGFDELDVADRDAGKFLSSHREQMKMAQQAGDSTWLREQAKKKAEEMAMAYVGEHPEMLKTLQPKLDLLMKKYSVVPNSADLSTAKKRNSLEGRTFGQRLVLAGNFQVVTLKPFAIDGSPAAGYRFNKKFHAGIGLNFRQSFGDTIATVVSNMFGYRLFSAYDVFRNFFAYAEYDRNSTGVLAAETLASREWQTAAFLGLGRKFFVSPGVEMTTIVVYNLIPDSPPAVYPGRWAIRLGLQTTDLAFLKRGR